MFMVKIYRKDVHDKDLQEVSDADLLGWNPMSNIGN
jgi:hypothetical protein